jgi:hypothetical protein
MYVYFINDKNRTCVQISSYNYIYVYLCIFTAITQRLLNGKNVEGMYVCIDVCIDLITLLNFNECLYGCACLYKYVYVCVHNKTYDFVF